MSTCKAGIYRILNLITNDFYIGSSVNVKRRLDVHFSFLRKNKHCNKHLQASFNIHGYINFKKEILEIVEDKNKLIEREQHYIDLLNPIYNKRKVARSNLGVRLSDAAKLKLRNFWLGKKRPMTPQHIENLKKAIKGKTKGKKKPEGFSEHLSKIRMGKGNPAYGKPSARRRAVYKLDLVTNEVIDRYDSISLTEYPRRVLACLRGNSKTSGGYKWIYA